MVNHILQMMVMFETDHIAISRVNAAGIIRCEEDYLSVLQEEYEKAGFDPEELQYGNLCDHLYKCVKIHDPLFTNDKYLYIVPTDIDLSDLHKRICLQENGIVEFSFSVPIDETAPYKPYTAESEAKLFHDWARRDTSIFEFLWHEYNRIYDDAGSFYDHFDELQHHVRTNKTKTANITDKDGTYVCWTMYADLCTFHEAISAA